jgi:hypothetical protein
VSDRSVIPGIFLLLVFFSTAGHAEMEKSVVPCEQKICFHWWPRLPVIEGWHHDREFSLKYSYNAQAPEGSTFENADTVIYAKAMYKPTVPDLKTLELLIENDRQKYLASDPDIMTKEADPLVTRDGKKLRSFMFHSPRQGSWDRVSYGEEGQFYLIFTLSSGSVAGYQKAVSAYEQFIELYKE